MNNPSKYEEDLASIRSLMERSARFISLSGLSGVFLGLYALAGSAYVYWLLNTNEGSPVMNERALVTKILLVAALVLASALLTAVLLTYRQMHKHGETPVLNEGAKLLLEHLLVPLAAGGAFTLILVMRAHYEYAAAVSLLFYGLSLVNASKYTFGDIKWLGYIDILLGLCAAVFYEFSILLWAVGFGVLHIIYGIVMHRKYDQ